LGAELHRLTQGCQVVGPKKDSPGSFLVGLAFPHRNIPFCCVSFPVQKHTTFPGSRFWWRKKRKVERRQIVTKKGNFQEKYCVGNEPAVVCIFPLLDGDPHCRLLEALVVGHFFPPLFSRGWKGDEQRGHPKKVFPGFSSNQQPCAPARPHPPFFTHPPSKSRWTYCPSHDLQFISALTWNINFVSCNQMKTLPRKTVNFHRNYFWHYQQYFPTRIETRHQLLNVLS
jgi:hypothetical protein